MRLMAAASRIDQWVLDATEAAYLWLLDRTGVFVGTLTFFGLSSTILVTRLYREGWWFDYVGLLLFSIIGASRYWAQLRKMHRTMNAEAEGWRKSLIRVLVTITWVGFLPMDYIDYGVLQVIASLATILVMYLWGARIRDREKPQEKLSGKLAPEGSR